MPDPLVEVPVGAGSIRMEHVPDCCCRYVAAPNNTSDVKLVDNRCMAAYLVPANRRERELAQINERLRTTTTPAEAAELLIIAHARLSTGVCACGFNKLGASHAKHIVEQMQKAGVLKEDYK